MSVNIPDSDLPLITRILLIEKGFIEHKTETGYKSLKDGDTVWFELKDGHYIVSNLELKNDRTAIQFISELAGQ